MDVNVHLGWLDLQEHECRRRSVSARPRYASRSAWPSRRSRIQRRSRKYSTWPSRGPRPACISPAMPKTRRARRWAAGPGPFRAEQSPIRWIVVGTAGRFYTFSVVGQRESHLRVRQGRSCQLLATCPSSVLAALRNLRRAGVLKNRSRTVTVVPAAATRFKPGLTSGRNLPPQTRRRRGSGAALVGADVCVRDRRDGGQGLAAEAHRRDAEQVILLGDLAGGVGRKGQRQVFLADAHRRRHRDALRPPSSIATSIRVAPASRAFSTSSLTTLAGRSMTSPAAILFIRCWGSWRIGIACISVGLTTWVPLLR